MSGKKKAEKPITLAQAQAVIAAHSEAEYAKKVAAAQKYVGRCYRTQNSYSQSEKWWLYGRVESIDAIGWPKGLTFQRTTSGQITVEPSSPIHVGAEWEEITETEFWSQAARHLGMVEGLLLKSK